MYIYIHIQARGCAPYLLTLEKELPVIFEHIYMYTYESIRIYTYLCVHMSTFTHTYIYMHTCIYIQARGCAPYLLTLEKVLPVGKQLRFTTYKTLASHKVYTYMCVYINIHVYRYLYG
jgi:hypothetical protein